MLLLIVLSKQDSSTTGVCKNVLCWKVLLCQNELASGAPASARVSVKRTDWRGVCMWASKSCSHYLFAFLPSNTCFIYLTFEPEGQIFVFCFSRTYAKFTVLDCLILGESSHLSNSDSLFLCWSLTGILLSSFCPQVYKRTICQRCTLNTIFQATKRERFKHTSLICS